MAGETKERVLQWITNSDTCFLIGAGCSKCAGKPLIEELTATVLTSVNQDIKTRFDELKSLGIRPPTIEDLINYLVRYSLLLKNVRDPATHSITPEWIEDALQVIKKEIVKNIADAWIYSSVHARFLQRVGKWSKASRDIFTLNYDTVFEATLDHLRYSYVDGFRGSRNAWFDQSVFEEKSAIGSNFRIHKLHGSVNWIREKTGHVRRVVISSADDITDQAVVVYPSEQKYLQTQFGIYETLIGRFRNRLRTPDVNNCLIILGYSFNDEHINEAIIDAVGATGSNLTVIAFIGPSTKADEQQAQLKDIAARCDHRFNAYVGKDFYVGEALDETESKTLLEEELWKFENLVDYIAGVVA
jgi:SIR2-like domain